MDEDHNELEVIIVDCDSVEGFLFSSWVQQFQSLYNHLTTTQQKNIWNRAVKEFLINAEVSNPNDTFNEQYTLEAISEPPVGIEENRVWLFRTKVIKRKPGRPRKEEQ